MKLKTWYLLIVAPPLALCLVLVLSTFDTAHDFTSRVDQLQSDGAAYVTVQGYANALSRKLQTAAFTLAKLELNEASDDQPLPDSGRAQVAPNGPHATTTLPVEPQSDAADSTAPIVLARAAVARSTMLADSAIVLGRKQRFASAESLLVRAEDIASDSALPAITIRVRHEAGQVDEGVAALSAQATGVLRLALGGRAARTLDDLDLDRTRLSDAVAFARAYQNVANVILRERAGTSSERDRRRAFTRAANAGAVLASDYTRDDEPPLLARALATLDTARQLNDSVGALAHGDPVARATALRRIFAAFSTEANSAVDSLPDLALAALRADLGTIAARAEAVRMVLGGLAILALIAGLGAAMALSRVIVAPIVELRRATASIAAGNFDVEAPRRRAVNEIGALYSAVYKMSTRLGSLIEAQRATEIELRASEQRQRSWAEHLDHLLESGPAIVFHLATSPTLKCTYVSKNIERHLGVDPEAWIADDTLFHQMVHPDDIPGMFAGIDTATAHGCVKTPFRIRRTDGEYRWFDGELRLVPNADGKAPEFIGWWTDVTELRQVAEAQRAAREAAESASQAKSDFLANMSHEIRTPMNGVMGMLELALDSELPPEQREYLEIAHTSAESLLTVINDILDFSKIEAGKMELDASPFRLAQTLEDTLTGLAIRAHRKGLELALRVDPDVPEAIVGDAGRLRQVIVNLVGNAVKFTEHGEVVVRVGNAAAVDGRVSLRFSVSDTGVGIDPSKQASIFEAFAQADASTTRTHGGTGLGLAIANRLVSLMGGSILLESEPGIGSTFYFTATFDTANLPAEDPAAESLDLTGVPVLVVDDNATNRAILEGMLGRWGMRPTVVDSGPAALALLRHEQMGRGHFRLMIVDAQMPGMDGFGLVERVRADEACGEPAIMMLSSATFHDDVRRCWEIGIDLYLTKPVHSEDLRGAICRLLRRSATAADARVATRYPRSESVGAGTTPLRVLLAEDNAVNRRLAIALLERRGAVTTVATNGREAVELWTPGAFDLVLMDIQMPELDGLEATRIIRSRETGVHTPIIALTARAMSGDRERCLAAGMDAYVAKPLRVAELMETITRLTSTTVAEAPAPSTIARSDVPVFDAEAIRLNTGGDDALAEELINLFQGDACAYLARIRQAVESNNARELYEAAHALKGASRAIGAEALARAALAAEKAGRGEELSGAAALADETARQLALLESTLATSPLRVGSAVAAG